MESEEQYELYFLPCAETPPHPLHSPPYQKPLRIHVCSPLSAIEKLLPNLPWKIDFYNQRDLQPAADVLARLIYRLLYRKEPNSPSDALPRLERLGWLNPNMPPDDVIYYGPNKDIDYYEVTFDHWVPFGEEDPEVLIIMICETEYEKAGHAKRLYRGSIDPKDYAPHRVEATVLKLIKTCKSERCGDARRFISSPHSDHPPLEIGIEMDLFYSSSNL